MERDFTYIDDIVGGIEKMVLKPPVADKDWDPIQSDPSKSSAPYRIYNIGNSSPVKLTHFIETIEKSLGKKAIKEMMPMQPGDVEKTWADVSALVKDYDYSPDTSVEYGIGQFIEWYNSYYSS
jgi:UDP-glucuronate 4-epimerase